MKKVIILHGYGGDSKQNWFPWLKNRLIDLNVDVVVPDMPETDAPELSAWLAHLQQVAGIVDEDTYLVGHSLGCATILRFLEHLEDGNPVGGAVLVAAFAEPIHFTELDSFTAGAWDDDRIKNACRKIVVINSDNDPHVPMEMALNIRKRFNAELSVMHNAEHINAKAGFTKVPLVYEKLVEIMATTAS